MRGLIMTAAVLGTGCHFSAPPADAYHKELVAKGRDVEKLRARGAELFVELGCIGCHRLEGHPNVAGIDLTNVGDRDVDLDGRIDVSDARWIEAHFLAPGKVRPGTYMPDFALSQAQAETLTIAMLDLRGSVPVALESALAPPTVATRSRARGAQLFRRFGCAGCHGVKGLGGVVNPNHPSETIPYLQLAERLVLTSKAETEAAIAVLESEPDLKKRLANPPFELYPYFLEQFELVRDVIRNGRSSDRRDENDPMPPLVMPAWGDRLDVVDAESILTWLLFEHVWDDDEEDE